MRVTRDVRLSAADDRSRFSFRRKAHRDNAAVYETERRANLEAFGRTKAGNCSISVGCAMDEAKRRFVSRVGWKFGNGGVVVQKTTECSF